MIILGLSRIKAKEEREKDRIDAKKYRESLAADTIFRGKRPSPSTSATSVNVGTVMRGGNGKLWFVEPIIEEEEGLKVGFILRNYLKNIILKKIN